MPPRERAPRRDSRSLGEGDAEDCDWICDLRLERFGGLVSGARVADPLVVDRGVTVLAVGID